MSIQQTRKVKANNAIAKRRLRERWAYRLRSRGYSYAEIANKIGLSEAGARAIFI